MATNTHTHTHVVAGSVLLAFLASCPTLAQESEETAIVIEEVVVTATRRPESLQDIPVSVSAFTGNDIRSMGIVNSEDLQNITPGLNVQGGFSLTSPQWNIRGVGSNGFFSNDIGGVGIYIDDVYINSNIGQGFYLFDTERVEVLRGPQGTLFGANTTGGAIQFISRRPPGEYGADANLTIGKFRQVLFDGAFDVPLNDATALRVAYFSHQNDGTNFNAFLNEHDQVTDIAAWRVSLQHQPAEDLELLFRAWNGKSTGDDFIGHSQGVLDPATGGLCNAADIAAFRCVDLFGYNQRATHSDFYTHEADQRSMGEVSTNGASMTINWTTNHFTVTSISAWVKTERLLGLDTDTGPDPLAVEEFNSEGDQYTQEVRFTSLGDSRLNWVAGLFILREDIYDSYFLNLPAFEFGLWREFDLENTNTSVFGEVTFDLTDRLRLMGGVRYSDEKKDVTDYFANQVDSSGYVPNVFHSRADLLARQLAVAIPATGVDDSWSAVSGRVAVDYRLAEDILAYGSFSRGFRGGNFASGVFDPAQLVTVDPELASTYEAGIKATFWDGKARLNAAVYHTDYQDLQVTTVQQALTLLSNAADATIKGGEIELALHPTEQLFSSFGVSFIDAEYDNFISPLGDFSGNELENAPEFAFNGLVRYEMPVFDRYRLTLQTDFSYKGEHFQDFSNNPLSVQEGYWLFNASATIGPEDGKYAIQFWGRNLGDTEYRRNWYDVSSLGFNGINIGAPLTVGVTLSLQL